MKGLWRLHWMTSEILAKQLSGEREEATAMVCQVQKILHQGAVDQGDWATGILLWPTPDPLGTEDFGGGMDEMKQIHAYKKALSELRIKHREGNAAATATTARPTRSRASPSTRRRPKPEPARSDREGGGAV